MNKYSGGELGSTTNCPPCGGGPCKVHWVVTAGSGYANNPFGAKAALVRAHSPVTTEGERAQAKLDARDRETNARGLVPTRRGYGVTIPNEREWLAQLAQQTPQTYIPDDRSRRGSGLSAGTGSSGRPPARRRRA